MYVVISYDIKHDRRRTQIHDLLQNYGYRVQYSVFECELTKPEYRELRERLGALTKVEEDDSVRYYALCEQCARKIERVGGITPRKKGAIVI